MKSNQHISSWFTRTAAGLLGGLVAFLIVMAEMSAYNIDHTSVSGALNIILTTLVFIILGARYCYKLFDLPQVEYYKVQHILLYKLFAMLWFGALGYYISLQIMSDANYLISLSATIFPGIIGFLLGYRILLFPSNLRGLLKSIMIGVIGFIIASLFFALFALLIMGPPAVHNPQSVMTIARIVIEVGNSIGAIYMLMGLGIFFYLPKVLLGSVCLYLIGVCCNALRKHEQV